ncbi:MAG: Fe-S cluster assembly protein SufB [Planctomycetes bacterium]|nr:Fe-S cluster assembly protein SufB [Planctomycetota bacterium]
MPTTALQELSAKALARVRKPRTRGAFQPIDAARRELGLLSVGNGEARISWLVDLATGTIADARFLAYGSLASHAIADAFTELARGRTVADACLLTAEQVDSLLRDDPLTPACGDSALTPFAFLSDLQAQAEHALPGVKLLPKPAEKVAYARPREADWTPEDRAWFTLSYLRKVARIDAIAARVLLARIGDGARQRIDKLNDDFRVVITFTGMAAEQIPTAAQFVQDALRGELHGRLSVDPAGTPAPVSAVPKPEAVPPAPAAKPVEEAAAPAFSAADAEAYKYGFRTAVEAVTLGRGLTEEVVRAISAARHEPEFLLRFRLKAYAKFLTMEEPDWSSVDYPKIDYQAISYYSAPKAAGAKSPTYNSLDEIDPEVLRTFEKLGISLEETKRLNNVAVDAVFDSVSVGTTHQARLFDAGVIFCSFMEAIHQFPELVERFLGTVVPIADNYFAALNSAVFSDGSFVYIPPHVRCPMELSTYFRINNTESGQFERTLIIADVGSHVSYLEGCTAPQSSKNQLHAAVVELVTLDDAEIKYSTVQNWYAGDPVTGAGGVYNFVTKRGACRGKRSKISWTQVETGSAITWKYPSCILIGDGSVGEFYSVALTNGRMQADTGTKMVHIGRDTRSTIVAKGISADHSRNVYRGLVKVFPKATGARNHTQCDSMLVGKHATAHTYPYIDVQNPGAQVEHEASTSKISEDQLFYLRSRGIAQEDAIGAIVSGFCKDVLQVLPLEFAAEAQKLLTLKLENSVG